MLARPAQVLALMEPWWGLIQPMELLMEAGAQNPPADNLQVLLAPIIGEEVAVGLHILLQ